MYVRFISPWRAGNARGYFGLFQPAVEIVYDEATPYHFYLPIRELLDWFNDNLPKPAEGSFAVRSRRIRRDVGICWFQSDAKEMIANAHILASILNECDVPIRKVTTHNPGQLLYQDDHQIVAKPIASTPVCWH